MKKLTLIKKFKTYLLLLMVFSLNTIAQDAVNENHMIIKFDQNSTFTFSASSVGCSFVQNIDCINAELWCVPDEMQIGTDTYVGEEAIADYFSSMGGIVEYAEPDWLVEEHITPNDPSYNQLWGMNKINAPQAWNTQTGSSNVVVGVIDSGVDWTHPDLIDNIWQNMAEDADGDGTVFEWDGSQWIFDPGDENGIDDDNNGYVDDFVGWDFHNNDNDPYDICGHGTHVAGTIGAKGNNNEGVSGVCWDVQMIALKFLEWNPAINRCTGSISNGLLALEYAVSMGAPISNNSWGGGPYSQAFYEGLEVAKQNDHLFVASAGNNGNLDNDQYPKYPASYDNSNIISVANTTSTDGISSSSHYGLTTVDLGAPGSGIYSTTPDNTYGNKSGTSMASPHVAGAAALLLSECGSLSYQEIKQALMSSTDPISALSGKCVTGGRLNANAAIQSLTCTPIPNCLTSDSLALVALYNSTNGATWFNPWDLSQPVSTWYGVNLTADGCNVYRLWLSDNNLTGTIPSELGNLTSLNHFDFSNNSLSGSLPSELGNLTNLESFNLSYNDLSGCYSQSHCNLLSNLLSFTLVFNPQLPDGGDSQGFYDFCNGNAPCPTNSSCLESDSLALVALYNSTDGTNWTNSWNLLQPVITWQGVTLSEDGCSVEEIFFASNNLNGNIPTEIGNLTNLTSLQIFDNELTGSIPNTIGNLTNLITLSLHLNQLTGNIPEEIGNLIYLEELELDRNQLTGNIPNTIGNLSNLFNLDLYQNQLTGNIPNTIGNLVNLKFMNIRANQLDGNIPNEIGNCSILISLSLHTNQLNGSIPSSLGNLSNLYTLALNNNNLSGCYPQSLCNLSGNTPSFQNNPDLPSGGSSVGFQAFCNGTAPPCVDDTQYCNAADLDLGPDVSLACGGSVTLSTGLTNMALTLWDYEGTLVGNTESIIINAPGTYIAVVTDICGNTGIDTIIVNQTGDCVWPGDINSDNIVNVYDVLFWGLDNGKTGPARSNGNFDWVGQACNTWTISDNYPVNDKHSDASGDGTVDFDDLDAITLNYGKVHGTNAPLNGNTVASFIAASDVNMNDDVGPNNGEIIIDLVLSEAVSNVHGLAWSIDLDFNGDIGDISFVHNSDWFGTEGSNLKVFYHNEPGYNTIDIAISRTDNQMVSGDGLIGHLIVTEDDILPWDDPDYNININIGEAAKINNQGNVTYLSNNSNGLVATSGGACPTFKIHNYDDYLNGYYQAENQITSSSIIEQNSVVDYRAGNQFTIKPGFTVKSGGEFKATIEDCQ